MTILRQPAMFSPLCQTGIRLRLVRFSRHAAAPLAAAAFAGGGADRGPLRKIPRHGPFEITDYFTLRDFRGKLTMEVIEDRIDPWAEGSVKPNACC